MLPELKRVLLQIAYICVFNVGIMAVKKKPTQFYATLSTSIVLVLIAVFLLVFFHADNIENIVKENVNILVELQDNIPSGQKKHLLKSISAYPEVKNTSVQLVSKEKAMELMTGDNNMVDLLEENPFKDIIRFNLYHDSYHRETIEKIKKEIEMEKGILGVYHESESLNLIKSNLKKVSIGILILAVCFIVLAMAIIFNTIKLTLYSDLKEIQTMQMVGATTFFIKKPYLRLAFGMSVKAFLTVMVVLGLILLYVVRYGGLLSEVVKWEYFVLTIIISFFMGFFMQMWGTNTILNRFLKQTQP